uniref:Zinc knuckle CX2CX4HX4C n=1 Tax=Helianthus annuus TaxID=4232 RepID=A0A251V5M0_HELAN
MHDVPLTAYTEDGLSLIASKIGVPKLLDTYTATMCADSWGRSSYARALIEVQAGAELKRSVTVAIPSLDGNGYSKVEVKIEYDWEPLRCSSCCVFGHDDNSCPKNPQVNMGGDTEK